MCLVGSIIPSLGRLLFRQIFESETCSNTHCVSSHVHDRKSTFPPSWSAAASHGRIVFKHCSNRIYTNRYIYFHATTHFWPQDLQPFGSSRYKFNIFYSSSLQSKSSIRDFVDIETFLTRFYAFSSTSVLEPWLFDFWRRILIISVYKISILDFYSLKFRL